MKYFLLLPFIFASPALAMMDHQNHTEMNHSDHNMVDTDSANMGMNHSMDHADHQMMEAEPEVMNHGTMHGLAPHHSDNPSTEAYLHIHHSMHEAMSIEFTGDADIDFLRGMIPHHQGAIDMAAVQSDYGQDGSVKTFANKIVRDQVKEIRWMGILLETLEAERTGSMTENKASIRANKLVNKHMHRKMMIDYTGNADVDFMTGMIPHHQGAVDMAKVVLKYGSDNRVKALANAIINAQETEITAMKKWLSRLAWRSERWRFGSW